MTFLALCKAGYGSLKELKEMDSNEILDIIEFENIRADIENYEIENSKRRKQ